MGPEFSRRFRLPDFQTLGNMKPYTPTAFTPQEIFVVLVSVQG
jgi:hypothetical protein